MSSPFVPQQPQFHQTIIVQQRQSQALPALVNAFCIPGLGQLIQGRLIAAMAWWLLYFFAALSIFIGIGFFLLPVVWLCCVIDAACYDSSGQSSNGIGKMFLILAGGCAAVLLVGMVVGIVFIGTAASAIQASPPVTPPSIAMPTETMPSPITTEPSETPIVDAPIAVAEIPTPVVDPTTITVATTPEPPAMRTWTSGQFKTEAEFVSAIGDAVKLKKSNGVIVTVSLDSLSVEDQQWIQGRAGK